MVQRSAGCYEFKYSWEFGLPARGHIEKIQNDWWIRPSDPEGPTGRFRTLSAAESYIREWGDETNLLMRSDEDPFDSVVIECPLGQWYEAKILEVGKLCWQVSSVDILTAFREFESRLGAEHALRTVRLPVPGDSFVKPIVGRFFLTFNGSLVYVTLIDSDEDAKVTVLRSTDHNLSKPGQLYFVSPSGEYISGGTERHKLLSLQTMSRKNADALF